jgi:hypothetical protein
MAVTMVTVSGVVKDPVLGTPIEGAVITWQPRPARIIDTAGNVLYYGALEPVKTNASGAWSVQVVSTEGVLPASWTYAVMVEFGTFSDVFDVAVPASPTAVDITDLAPVEAQSGAIGDFMPRVGGTGVNADFKGLDTSRAGLRVRNIAGNATLFEVTEFNTNSNNPIACPHISEGGVNVYAGASTPGGSIPTNSYWLSPTGVQRYNGSAWVPA